MKILIPLFVVLASGLGLAFSGHGQEDGGMPDHASGDPFQAGPEHAFLQKLEGTWDAMVVIQDETGAEHRSAGTMTSVRHGSFHTLDSFKGEVMGMEFVGHGVNGYCGVRKQYFTFWTDSMTPSPMAVYGDYDAAKRELTMRGEALGMSGRLEPCRTVTRYTDDDHTEWAMFGAGPDGAEMQQIRIEYTRRR
jgi:hypothetical protein